MTIAIYAFENRNLSLIKCKKNDVQQRYFIGESLNDLGMLISIMEIEVLFVVTFIGNITCFNEHIEMCNCIWSIGAQRTPPIYLNK